MANLLIADREIASKRSLKTYLNQQGHTIVGQALNSNELLRMANQQLVDIVLLEQNFPGKLDVLTTGREIEEKRKIPVICILSEGVDEQEDYKENINLSGYLFKPFTQRELNNAIRISLNRSNLEKKLMISLRYQKESLIRQKSICEFLSHLNSEFDAFTRLEENLKELRHKLNIERITIFRIVDKNQLKILFDTKQNTVGRELNGLEHILKCASSESIKHLDTPLYMKPDIKRISDFRIYITPLHTSKETIYGNLSFVIHKNMIARTNIRSHFDVINNAICTALKRHQSIEIIKKLELEKTEREKQLLRSEKLVMMGQMMSAIGHELNQPLQSIKLLADSILYWESENEGLPREQILLNLKKISARVVHSDQIIRNMMQMIKGSNQIGKQNVNLNDVIRDTLKFYNEELKQHKISPIVWQQHNTAEIRGSVVQLQQMIVNLINNAITALDSINRDKKKIFLSTFEEENRIILSIADNGPGIPDEKKRKIFEPFYTESCGENNIGMGLYVVFNFVKTHNADLEILDIENDTGVEIRIYFNKEYKR